jgi:hypothetical protein
MMHGQQNTKFKQVKHILTRTNLTYTCVLEEESTEFVNRFRMCDVYSVKFLQMTHKDWIY